MVVHPLKNLSEFWVTRRCPFSLSLYKLGFISQQWWTRSSGRRKLWHLTVNEWDRSKWPELYGQEMEASRIVTIDRCPSCDQHELEGENALDELIVAMFLSSFSSRRQQEALSFFYFLFWSLWLASPCDHEISSWLLRSLRNIFLFFITFTQNSSLHSRRWLSSVSWHRFCGWISSWFSLEVELIVSFL